MDQLIGDNIKSINNYWSKRLQKVKKALESNNFAVFIANSSSEAREIMLNDIIPQISPKSISWGGSISAHATGIFKELLELKKDEIQIIDGEEIGVPWEELFERRRQALLVDLFISGTNAITESGHLINLDAVGNRVAGITFGPCHVIIIVGRNKIVTDLEEARARVKKYTAPINVMNLGFKTPCAITGYCEDCKSPERICNTWTITEKSWEKGRIKVILINQDLGF